MNWVRTGSRNGLSPVRCQTITWSNSDLQSIGPSGTNFIEIWIKIQKCSFMQNAFENTVCDLAAICPGDELTYKNPQYLSTIIIIKACHTGVNYWDYYPAAHAKIENSRMHILRCTYGFKILCEISKVPFEISHKFWTHTPQNMHLTGC